MIQSTFLQVVECRPMRSWTISALRTTAAAPSSHPKHPGCRITTCLFVINFWTYLCSYYITWCIMRRATHLSTQIACSLIAVLHTTNQNSWATVALPVVFTGDVNICLDRRDDASCQQFTELLTSFDLLQHVDQPTHDLSGILDVVVTRSDLAHPVAEVVDVGISDHRLIKWTLDVESSPPVYEMSSWRSWHGFDAETFRSALRESNLCNVNYAAQSGIDDMVKEYDSSIVDILDRLASIMQVTHRT